MYKLIDSGDFYKLEQVGPYRLVRPAPGAVWKPSLAKSDWAKPDARFERLKSGDGRWEILNSKLPKQWQIQFGELELLIKLTSFGHIGLFAEQEKNWADLRKLIKTPSNSPFKVLNLFAYTGGSTLACSQVGAEVTHVDASKGTVNWASQNAEISGLKEAPIRWMVEDAAKFVEKEVRRGKAYHGIILDPPSYGRGANKEVWKIEDHLGPLLDNLKKLLDEDFQFVLLSSHSPGYTPLSLQNLLSQMLDSFKGRFIAEEMVIAGNHLALPSGASCLFVRD